LEKRSFTSDGGNFSTLETFYDEVERVLFAGMGWVRNLDALSEILRSGFGSP